MKSVAENLDVWMYALLTPLQLVKYMMYIYIYDIYIKVMLYIYVFIYIKCRHVDASSSKVHKPTFQFGSE